MVFDESGISMSDKNVILSLTVHSVKLVHPVLINNNLAFFIKMISQQIFADKTELMAINTYSWRHQSTQFPSHGFFEITGCRNIKFNPDQARVYHWKWRIKVRKMIQADLMAFYGRTCIWIWIHMYVVIGEPEEILKVEFKLSIFDQKRHIFTYYNNL